MEHETEAQLSVNRSAIFVKGKLFHDIFLVFLPFTFYILFFRVLLCVPEEFRTHSIKKLLCLRKMGS